MTKEQLQAIYACNEHGYIFAHHSEYDFSKLDRCILKYIRKGRSQDKRSYNDCIIMADTETSKKDPDKVYHNHIVAWTITLRANGGNLLTLWGRSPYTMVDTMEKLHRAMKGDRTIIFFHNLPYDYTFLRRFLFDSWGTPEQILNVKPHYPLFMEFSNGIMLRDSLMLAQRSLDKWAKDLQVKHQKAVGKWDYDKVRTQHEDFTRDELEYIEHDTLAGVECLDKTMAVLHKHVYSLPYTATGIPRGDVRACAKGHRAKDLFDRIVPTWEQQKKLEVCFHGGYTHANRYYIERNVIGNIICYDLASSYPFRILSNKFPMEKFTPIGACLPEDILKCTDKYAFYFKLILVKPRLKNGLYPMPVLQYSKTVRTINPIMDNGRILAAAYIEIWITEQDLIIINEQYEADKMYCVEVESAMKDYLPMWLRKYVYECFTDKTRLKGGDPVAYALAKAKVNSIFGMMVQKPVKEDIIENYKYSDDNDEKNPYYVNDEKDLETLYERWKEKKTSILAYQWGCWITAYSLVGLFRLGECVDKNGIWLYSDTDSVYATKWDLRKLKKYNEDCINMLKCAGFDGVVHNGRTYYLGVAEKDGEYTEFKTTGAKRYCKKENGEIKITVAGVPKKGAACIKSMDDFKVGLRFPGTITGKKTHTYFYNEIYTDPKGNVTGDSIDLSPCDYVLDACEVIPNWELLFEEEIQVQIAGGET